MGMNARHLLMAAGVAGAGWLALFGDKTPDSEIAAPLAVAAPVRPAAKEATKAAPVRPQEIAAPIQALLPRENLIRAARHADGDAALFTSQSWTPPPPPPPKPSELPPPPLPFTYLGKKFEDGAWEVYLARGERTFIARRQAVLEGGYRVDTIAPPNLSFTYLPLNKVQRLNIGGAD